MGISIELIYREAQSMARHLSIAEWLQAALELVRRRMPVRNAARKLDIIRAAARHNYPVTDIADMLAEIETGYATGWNRHGVS